MDAFPSGANLIVNYEVGATRITHGKAGDAPLRTSGFHARSNRLALGYERLPRFVAVLKPSAVPIKDRIHES